MAEVVFVGTGDAFGSGGRRNSAILVRDRGKTLLLDCGPTTLGGLQELGVDPRELDAIVISHFHGDHCAGIPFLLIDYLYEHQRTTPLHIVGPPGIQQRVETLKRAFEYREEQERSYSLDYVELAPERDISLDGFTLTPFPAFHHPSTKPHMVRVRASDRQVMFTGDTGWHDKLPDYVGDVDLLIAECVFFDRDFKYHLNHEQLRRERARLRAERVVLTHLGSEVLTNLDRVQFDTARDGLILGI
jgi:ribonuclease BN (tRNA processing enzyme)